MIDTAGLGRGTAGPTSGVTPSPAARRGANNVDGHRHGNNDKDGISAVDGLIGVVPRDRGRAARAGAFLLIDAIARVLLVSFINQ